MMLPDVLLIGAGLAGLTAARTLHAAGRTVLVLDKGRGVGGRAATRRWDGARVDHGAQFFTVRDAGFRAVADRWLDAGICFEWARNFHQWDPDGRGLRAPDSGDAGHPRYACREGMSALSKELAAALPPDALRLTARVNAVRWVDGHWQADLEGAPAGAAPVAGRRLILALPAPQALALLGPADRLESSPLVSPGALATLRGIRTAPALAVLLAGPVPPPGWRGIQLRDEILSWVSDDSSKRESGGDERVFVLHGSEGFSAEWQDRDLDEAARRMVARAGEIVGDWITDLPRRQVHRWRYASVPQGAKDVAFLRATGDARAPLYFAGDGFLGGKLEGACRSGLLLAGEILGDA